MGLASAAEKGHAHENADCYAQGLRNPVVVHGVLEEETGAEN
jgi:hypothetical protein